MKGIIYTAFFLLAIGLFQESTVFAYNQNEFKELIETFHEDITGDGQKEKIELKGNLFSPNSNYYHDIVAFITSPTGETWEIAYGGGYDPELLFIDINHDQVVELFFQAAGRGEGGLHHYHFHTIENNEVTEIPLPKQEFVQGVFADQFKVKIHIDPDLEHQYIDVKNRASLYTKKGIYNNDGQLQKTATTMVDPIAFFRPALISKSKGYGFKSYQHVYGAGRHDKLGTVETLWYFENGKWQILYTELVPKT